MPIAGEILYIDPGLPWGYDAGIPLGQLFAQTDSGGEAETDLGDSFIQTAKGLQSGVEFGLFLAIWLPGCLTLIPLIHRLAKNTRCRLLQTGKKDIS